MEEQVKGRPSRIVGVDPNLGLGFFCGDLRSLTAGRTDLGVLGESRHAWRHTGVSTELGLTWRTGELGDRQHKYGPGRIKAPGCGWFRPFLVNAINVIGICTVLGAWSGRAPFVLRSYSSA